MDFLRTSRPGRRWAPGPASSLAPHAGPGARAVDARRCCRLGFLGPPSLLCSSFLYLISPPLSADRWARCSGIADSAICAGAQAAARASPGRPLPWMRPRPHSPISTQHPTPTPLCWLLHLSLPLGFRVFTIHPSSFQVLSPLTKRRDLQRTSLAANGRLFSLTV